MLSFLIGAMLVGGTVGGLAGLIGYDQQYQQAQSDADYQIQEYERQLQQELDKLDFSFDQATEKANKEADKQDKQSTLNEGYTAEGFNNNLGQIQANQNAEALGFNQAAQSIGKSTGDALSGMAASGTRSGSMNTAVDLESAMNAMQLQATEDQARASDKIQLANLFTDLNKSVNQIQTNRTDALDLRKSYMEGGDQWTAWQKNRQWTTENANAAIDAIKRQKEQAAANYGWGSFSSMLSGFGSGASFGFNAANFYSNWKNPTGGK